MKELFLIPIMLAVFAFGYYIMTRVDHFIEENQRLITAENRKGRCPVRIAVESPMLLDSVASALEGCSEADPYIEFFLSSGSANRLLEKLMHEQIDILLLTKEHIEQLDRQYALVLIPYQQTMMFTASLGLPVGNPDEETGIGVVWKKGLKSRNRDRVIFALENEYCRLKCGYADYLN